MVIITVGKKNLRESIEKSAIINTLHLTLPLQPILNNEIHFGHIYLVINNSVSLIMILNYIDNQVFKSVKDSCYV